MFGFWVLFRVIANNATYNPKGELDARRQKMEEDRRNMFEQLSKLAENAGAHQISDGPDFETITYSNITIISFLPMKIPSKTRTKVIIETSPPINKSCYCRFGNYVLSGFISTNHTITCQSPLLSVGETNLYVSHNRKEWTIPVTVTIYDNDSYISIILMVLGISVVVALYNMFNNYRIKSIKGKKHKEEDELPLVNSSINDKKKKKVAV